MSIFSGLDSAALQALLTQAQTALADLMLGNKPVTVTYQQGDGQRTVTFKPTDLSTLRAFIQELQTALNIPCAGRRPIRVMF